MCEQLTRLSLAVFELSLQFAFSGVPKEAASWLGQSAVLGCNTRALISQAPINSRAAVAVIGGYGVRDRWGG